MSWPEIWITLSRPQVAYALGLTLRTCIACLLLHAITAVPLAWWSQKRTAPFRRLISFVITLPLVFPPMALGFLLLMFFGARGAGGHFLREYFGVSLIFSQAGVIFAAYLAGLPLVVKPVQASLSNPELKKLAQAARVSGAGPLAVFFLLTLPLIRHSVAAGLLLGLTRALGEVGITLMLGGNISGKTNTLSLEVYNAVNMGEFNQAMILCLLLGALSLLLYLAIDFFQRQEPL